MNTEPFYLLLIVFLFCLAIFDLTVGVANDVVNFLSLALGNNEDVKTFNSNSVTLFLHDAIKIFETGDYEARKNLFTSNKELVKQFSELKRRQLKRIQINQASTKVGIVYISIVQKIQDIVSYTINLLKVNRKLQEDS